MPSFSYLARKHRKWIGLFALTVVLPVLVLGILAVAAFRGEEARQSFQRRERQQQIARLLDADLTAWLVSLQGSSRASEQHRDGRLPPLGWELPDPEVLWPLAHVATVRLAEVERRPRPPTQVLVRGQREKPLPQIAAFDLAQE